MKKLLHIIATPRDEKSRTLKISRAFLDEIRQKKHDLEIDTLDLFTANLPEITELVTRGKYTLMSEGSFSDSIREAWDAVENHIKRFLSADACLISTPMWNFSVPYRLKHYIDIIIQPKYLFKYTEEGVQGLAGDKKVVVITSRGGDYGPDSPFHKYDFLEPYLKQVLGFVGIVDITFINAQPMDALGTEIMLEKIRTCKEKARKIAAEMTED